MLNCRCYASRWSPGSAGCVHVLLSYSAPTVPSIGRLGQTRAMANSMAASCDLLAALDGPDGYPAKSAARLEENR
jgi:hypothetical protein